ncbi:transcription factor IIIA [Tanacetum coccineum]
MKEEEINNNKKTKVGDIRRYACEYCGIVRSKKTIITAHIQSHHKDEIKDKEGDKESQEMGKKMNVCEECGVSFQKPAHLKQHMQSHSLEVGRPPEKLRQVILNHAMKCTRFKDSLIGDRPFTCPIDDCNSSYRRKDHLNRHLLQHKSKLFERLDENCKKDIHENKVSKSGDNMKDKMEHTCLEPGCGKVFKYASKLQKHEESHVKLETVEAFCAEPGCMKYFTKERLKAHFQSNHQHINCEICGSKQLKKNIKRHLQTHDNLVSKERIICSFDGCNLTFSNNSNLQQHIKSVHLQEKPFICSFSDCGMRFSYKHVRDNHEKSGRHVYTLGDFVESDKQFHSKPRGGVKRKLPDTIRILMTKKTFPPSKNEDIHGYDYVSWFTNCS